MVFGKEDAQLIFNVFNALKLTSRHGENRQNVKKASAGKFFLKFAILFRCLKRFIYERQKQRQPEKKIFAKIIRYSKYPYSKYQLNPPTFI